MVDPEPRDPRLVDQLLAGETEVLGDVVEHLRRSDRPCLRRERRKESSRGPP